MSIYKHVLCGRRSTLISDTCILSCLSSKCDLRHHIQTQFPYAITVAMLATLLGYLPVGMAYEHFPAWAGLLVGGASTALFAFVLSVPVLSDKKDPLTVIFGRWWDAPGKDGVHVGEIPGFLTNGVSFRRESSLEKVGSQAGVLLTGRRGDATVMAPPEREVHRLGSGSLEGAMSSMRMQSMRSMRTMSLSKHDEETSASAPSSAAV